MGGSAVTRSSALAVACTDEGQHEWAQLGDLVLEGQKIWVNCGFTQAAIAERRKHECVWIDDHRKVHMACPRCRREIQRTEHKMGAAMQAMVEAGVNVLDISLLS
jgi:hypothetical protein